MEKTVLKKKKAKKLSQQSSKQRYEEGDPEASQPAVNSQTFSNPPYPMFSPHLANALTDVLLPSPNAFTQFPYPFSYCHQCFPLIAALSHLSRLYYYFNCMYGTRWGEESCGLG